MNSDYIKAMEDTYNLITQANNESIAVWLEYAFLSWRWWLGLSLSIIPWVVWLIFRRKDSTDRILYAGLFVMLISSWFDILGILFGLWSYYYSVVPFSPAFIPWDFTLLPVIIMFLLQVKPQISPIIKAVALSTFSCFIVEPGFVMIGLYNPKNWKFVYSFPIIIAIYLISDWISKRQKFEKISN